MSVIMIATQITGEHPKGYIDPSGGALNRDRAVPQTSRSDTQIRHCLHAGRCRDFDSQAESCEFEPRLPLQILRRRNSQSLEIRLTTDSKSIRISAYLILQNERNFKLCVRQTIRAVSNSRIPDHLLPAVFEDIYDESRVSLGRFS
jgi:hypothetical protein